MRYKIIYTIGLLLFCYILQAQGISPEQPIPTDPTIRIGKLENGLTYYICHCENPSNRAEFYIVHNVGALQEEANQRGLAHFLEHLAFNGTTNFPKKRMLEYLAGIGVSFGANVNAFTSKTVTAYNISAVPLVRESIVDTVLLMLHDWSGYIACEPEEIEAERGVIREEWRRSQLPRTRLAEQLAPVLYNYSKYANNVLGEYDIIMNFKKETLLDFYHKWYRPDLQAVIVVGDFDVDWMEQKIKATMSQLKKAVNPAPKEIYTIPDNQEPLVGISTDPVAAATVVRIGYKQHIPGGKERSLYSTFRTEVKRSMIVNLLKNRLAEKNLEQSPSLIQKTASYGDLSPEKKMIFIMATVKEAQVLPALNELAEEMECVKRYGFSSDEFSEIQAQMLKNNKVQNAIDAAHEADNIVKSCLKHFTEQAPLASKEYNNQLFVKAVNEITLEEINRDILTTFGDKNMLITLIGPEKEGLTYPSEKEFVATVKQVKKKKIEPFVRKKVEHKELMPKKPTPGHIVQEKQGVLPGTVEWTLSNGARVVLKSIPTSSKQVIMNASSEGGLSILADDELPSATIMNQYIRKMGIGEFSRSTLAQMNVGKIASIDPKVDAYHEELSGNAVVKDMETLMQMVHLYFTAPRFDEKEFNTHFENTKRLMINRKDIPKMAYQNRVAEAKYNNHPRMKVLSLQDTSRIDFETAKRAFRKCFSNAKGFTFVFVGKIEPEVLKPLIETYIASLPAKEDNNEYRDNNIRFTKGEKIEHTEMEMPTPRATVDVLYSAYSPITPQSHICAAALQYIIGERYMQSIREDKGGTYHVAVQIDENFIPENQTAVKVNFETNPELVDELLTIVQQETEAITKEAPQLTELENARQYFEKCFKSNITKERYWTEVLNEYYKYGIDNYSNYKKTLDELTPEDIRVYAEKIFSQKNKMEFVLKSKN